MAAAPLYCFTPIMAWLVIAVIATPHHTFALLHTHTATGSGMLQQLHSGNGASDAASGHLVQVVVRPLGAKVRLKCDIRSSKVFWTKDGRPVACEDGGCRTTLRLANVTRHQAGMYQCWRPHGRLVPPSVRLKITDGSGRPKLLGPLPSNVSVVAGAPASLRCRVHSALSPNIQWLRRIENSALISAPLSAALSSNPNKTIQYEGDTYEVLSSSGEAALANHSYLTKLLLAHTTEDDTGFYVCLATNNHGFRFRGTHLTVLPRSPAGLLVPQGLLHVEVALILLVVLLVASPVLALTYLAYAHRQALLARKQPTVPASAAL